ncbi:hypothetical protein AAMO2058_001337700 [Amorphochlora amoebiformis]
MGDREEVGPVALFLLVCFPKAALKLIILDFYQDSEQNDTKQDAAIEYNSEKILSKEKFILKRKAGQLSPPRGGANRGDENQQLIEIPEEDEDDSSTSDPSEDLEQEFFDSLDPQDLKMLLKRLKQEERKEKAERRAAKRRRKEAALASGGSKKKKKRKKKSTKDKVKKKKKSKKGDR